MSNKLVSIIIVNYNTASLIEDCIQSIVKYTKNVNYEIIVVDNNSHGDNIQILKKINQISKLILLDVNLGFGGANNKGVEQASGKFLFFLNPDTLLCNNAIKILVDFLTAHSQCGACGGNLYNVHMTLIHSHNKRFPGVIDELDQALKRSLSYLLDKGNTLFNTTIHPLEVAFITGADLMIPKHIFTQVDGFDPKFFMYYEDTQLQYKIRKLGYKIFNVPTAKIIHLEGQSFKLSRDREKRILISRRKYYLLTGGKRRLKFMDKYYTTITSVSYFIAWLFRMKSMKEKLYQRLSLLNEIINEQVIDKR